VSGLPGADGHIGMKGTWTAWNRGVPGSHGQKREPGECGWAGTDGLWGQHGRKGEHECNGIPGSPGWDSQKGELREHGIDESPEVDGHGLPGGNGVDGGI